MLIHSRSYKALIWVWIAALFGASVGISVEQVYCYCVGKTTVSLFKADDACHIRQSAESCCAAKKDVSTGRPCKQSVDPEKGCSKKTTRYFQLKTDSEISEVPFKIPDTIKGFVETLPPAFDYRFGFPLELHLLPPGPERSPPFVSGRQICILYRVFRC